MDDPQIIKTPGGEEMVVLSRHEYDAMVHALAEAEEELADIATLDQRLTELAVDPNAKLPSDVSAMILDGHVRLRAVRKWRSLGIAELASKSGVPETVINQIEAASTSPTKDQASKLAAALGVPQKWLD